MRGAFILALLIAMVPGAALTQDRPQSVDLDEIVDVRLDENGRGLLRFRTRDTGRLRGDLFAAPVSSGAISFTFGGRGETTATNEDGEKTASPVGLVYAPGRYEALVEAENPGEAVVQLRISLDVPFDEYEPNDSREDAVRIDMPFRGLVHLDAGEPDWFRVDPESGGIVGVHLFTNYAYPGLRIGFYRPNGDEILITGDSQWETQGMRYVRSTGEPIYIALWDSNDWADGDTNAYKGVEIAQYRPQGAPASDRPLVTLGLESDNPAFFQLDLIGRAIGVETVAADEAATIAQELETAIRGRGMGTGAYVVLLLLLLAAGGGGFFVWRRFSQDASPKAVPAPPPDMPPAANDDSTA